MQISVTEQGSIMRDQRKTIYDPDYGIFLVYAPVNFSGIFECPGIPNASEIAPPQRKNCENRDIRIRLN